MGVARGDHSRGVLFGRRVLPRRHLGAVFVAEQIERRPVGKIQPTIPVQHDTRWNLPVIPMLWSDAPGFGYYVFGMPVTSEENRIRGCDIWGLPKRTHGIDIEGVTRATRDRRAQTARVWRDRRQNGFVDQAHAGALFDMNRYVQRADVLEYRRLALLSGAIPALMGLLPIYFFIHYWIDKYLSKSCA